MGKAFEVPPGRLFPNLAPPFDSTFVEYMRPKAGLTGWLFAAAEAKPSAAGDQLGGEDHWYVHGFLFRHVLDRVSCTGYVGYPVNEDGTLSMPDGIYEGQMAHSDLKEALANKPDYPTALFNLALFLWPAWQTIALMHCSNIELVVNEPAEKLNRARIKRGKVPLVRFHTLRIRPMKEVLRRITPGEKTGVKLALHLCRGHFVRYGDAYGKGKLFGKLEGEFFIPSHARGSLKQGAVVKDYLVKAPEQHQLAGARRNQN